MITKTKLKEQIASLPEEFSIDELIDRLIFIDKVEKGLKQSEEGLVISDTELNNEIAQWFK